ncbi:uncharacterized protein HMPREF1541_08288 [Cyphellophora europaea CBS 101466]|uniref:Structural maintenance of chromosomes protein 5 n=1 Tax=Cyphellophora europaea (strain CBS 101466) TaxID=1220924 RepID=W2RLE0_CYPE1|nr:uncharacterized protein HMPREF1541_08288 [Cyphellophora europaea CBS 101466]ETN37297.1 hypothetical protein HMPREF1541_08288 [Cyphellophora europaea CBS 101466]
MARLAVRRTRSPEPEDSDSSRPQTPLSTAPNDRKRARRNTTTSPQPRNVNGDQGPSQQRHGGNPSRLLSSGKRDANHQPGAIVRVKLTNFVTYTKAEFFPGPSLNMVIGPNGTGKSTLVCAICLGLGWPPTLLGRAKDLGEFVKHGASDAQIEIELKRGPSKEGARQRKNHIVRRSIVKDGNKSKWWLDGNESGSAAIRALASSFGIQIDNLCQFLPQDRVVEFAQMKPHEVLLSTQQAAGTPRMVQCYNVLLKLRNELKEHLGGQRTDRDELDNLKRRHEAQRVEVDRERDRKKYKQKLEYLQRAKVFPEYISAKATAEEAKEAQKRLANELRQLEEEAEPALRKVKAKQVYKHKVTLLKKQCEEELKASSGECDNVRSELADLETKMQDFDNQIKADRDQVSTKKTELRKHQMRVQQLENQLQHPPLEFDPRAMAEEINDRNREVTDLEADKRNAQDRRDGLERQADKRKHDIANKEQQIKNFDTQAGRRESQLETLSKDTAQAWRFIQGNRILFEKPVFGPPAVECTVENKNMAKAIESMLQAGDFRIITAQTQNDYELLQKKLIGELRLHQISLRLRYEDESTNIPKPYTLEELRQYGLHSFAIDHIQGPAAVLAMLCAEKKLNQCAIANGRITQEQHDAMKTSKIQSYYADGQINSFRRRLDLGPDAILSMSNSAKEPQVWTDKPVDHGRKALLQRDVAELRGELEEAQTGIKECQAEIEQTADRIRELKTQVEAIRKDKTEKQNAQTAFNALPQRIADAQRLVAEVDDWLRNARERRETWIQEKDETAVERAETAVRFADASRGFKEAMLKLIEVEVQLVEATSDQEVLEQRNSNLRVALEERKTAQRQAADRATTAFKKRRDLWSRVKAISEEAQAEKEAGNDEFLALIQDMTTRKWTPEDWEGEVETVNANIALTEGGSGDAIRQYEEREKRITVLEGRLSSFDGEVQNIRGAIKDIRDEWEPELDSIVAKISDAFGDNFARIGCAGQVEVHKASSTAMEDCSDENGGQGNGLDFANWAIHISVKFRENEPLSLLDSHRQSGGERAVSTIFYLMALQSLSRAPFRVVDEINQGMDGRNERMVHGRMVDIATASRDDGGQGSQYFLITPKLLSGLKYKRGMTVLCIVSGESVPGEGEKASPDDRERIGWEVYPRMDFTKLAETARGLGLATSVPVGATMGGLGRRVDSGVALVGA